MTTIADHLNTPPQPAPIVPEAQLEDRTPKPKGALQRNLKMLMYLGAALLLIVASLLGNRSKTPKEAAKGKPPQPLLQDTTENNVQALKSQIATEEAKQQQDAAVTAAMRQLANPAPTSNGVNPTTGQPAQMYGNPDPDYAPGGSFFGCQPGQPCTPQMQQQNQEPPQLTPLQQQQLLIETKDRELVHSSLFASNIAYSAKPGQGQAHTGSAAQPALPAYNGQPGLISTASYGQAPQQEAVSGDGQQYAPNGAQQAPQGSLVSPRAADTSAATATAYKRPPEVNVNAAVGQPYVVLEGSFLDTVLMNRLDGDASGSVKVLVSNPLYSHDHQQVVIPEGTVVLGEAKKIGSTGFGQQRRMAVIFHRLIMPDGYSVDLDQFKGLDQIGEQGLKDKVNNHYLEIFGTSVALGVISGAAQITEGGGTITTSGKQAFTTGTAAGVSQQATTVLDRFIQIPPTITIREGHRVKVYFTQDLLLPSYQNHTIPQTF
ncbi:MAG: TrbI/VirB10 family protein [Acidobacteriaceae bacterium]